MSPGLQPWSGRRAGVQATRPSATASGTADRIAGTGSLWACGRINAAAAVAPSSRRPPTADAYPDPACPTPTSPAPRPPVGLHAAPTGQRPVPPARRLQVTLTPSSNPGQPNNQIQAVQLGTLQNAAVDVPVRAGRAVRAERAGQQRPGRPERAGREPPVVRAARGPGRLHGPADRDRRLRRLADARRRRHRRAVGRCQASGDELGDRNWQRRVYEDARSVVTSARHASRSPAPSSSMR